VARFLYDDGIPESKRKPPFPYDPVIEAYKKDVDRTLLRENLKLTVTERFEKAMALQRFAEEMQLAGKAAKKVASETAGGDTKRMVKSVEGVYRNGKVDLLEPIDEVEGSRVIVTWVHPEAVIDLRTRGIDESQAADLRHRLGTFTEDWERPEMSVYDELPPR